MSKKNLVIEENKAKELYKTADISFKQILEDTFGKEFFSTKITDKVKSWKDIVEIHETLYGKISLPTEGRNKQELSINAFYKIQCISKVLNESWIPNFLNSSEKKYYPYFEKSSGGGWLVCSYSYWYAVSTMGFGLYFKSSELALFAGNTFLDIYKDYLPE